MTRSQAGRLTCRVSGVATVGVVVCIVLASALLAVRVRPARAEGVVIGGGPGDQRSPALAAGAAGFLAAWETCDDCEARGADLVVRPLGVTGAPSGDARLIEASAADARAPGVAYNPDTGEFLVVWSSRYPGTTDRFAVVARRVGADGAPRGEATTVAEVTGVWPGAVVSSRGAWHGYDVAWAAPGPRPDGVVTVIHTRHLDASGAPASEEWALSDAGYEALGARALRSAGTSGSLVAWFAYRLDDVDERPHLLGVRLGVSGRPIGAARPLADGVVCAAALTDHSVRAEIFLATVGCAGTTTEPTGALRVARLTRAGDLLDEAVTVTDTVPARDLAVTADDGGHYLLVAPARMGGDEPGADLTFRHFDADGGAVGAIGVLGAGGDPAAAGGTDGGTVVLAARAGQGSDIVAWYLTAPALPATGTPPPSGTPVPPPPSPTPTTAPAASPSVTWGPPITPGPTASATVSSTPTPPATASATGVARRVLIYLPLAETRPDRVGAAGVTPARRAGAGR
jgi:hypothetical protein